MIPEITNITRLYLGRNWIRAVSAENTIKGFNLGFIVWTASRSRSGFLLQHCHPWITSTETPAWVLQLSLILYRGHEENLIRELRVSFAPSRTRKRWWRSGAWDQSLPQQCKLCIAQRHTELKKEKVFSWFELFDGLVHNGDEHRLDQFTEGVSTFPVEGPRCISNQFSYNLYFVSIVQENSTEDLRLHNDVRWKYDEAT